MFMKYLSLTVTVLFLSGCASIAKPTISDASKDLLVQPVVDCEKAPSDIKALESVRPSFPDKAVATLVSIIPGGILAGLVMGDFSNRWDVISGNFEDSIDKRIVEIQKTCPHT